MVRYAEASSQQQLHMASWALQILENFPVLEGNVCGVMLLQWVICASQGALLVVCLNLRGFSCCRHCFSGSVNLWVHVKQKLKAAG